MKRKIMLTIVGMSIVLTACAGAEKTTEPESEEKAGAVETIVVQDEKESLVQESETQEETESSEETASSEEIASIEETNSGEETNSIEETAAGLETNETEAAAVEEEKVTQAKGSFTQADIAVSVRGVAVVPGEIMENYINALGEPDALDFSPSCVEAGDDKTYTYGGVIIYSYRANGTDRINLIEIEGTESLVKGIHIGDTTEAVIEAYGDSYTMEGDEMLYEVNDKVMGFMIANGKVSFIELFAR